MTNPRTSGSVNWYPSAAASGWLEATTKKVATLPDRLKERNEEEAAALLRRLLDRSIFADQLTFIARDFDLSRRSALSVRQKDVSGLRVQATEIEKALAALQARQAEVLGALTQADRVPGGVGRPALTIAFNAAFAAMAEVVMRLAEVEGAVIAEVGTDRGGPALTAPSAPPVEVLGHALAERWIEEGLGLVGPEGQAFTAVLRALNEAVTGSEDIKSEARVIARLRDHFCKNPPKKS